MIINREAAACYGRGFSEAGNGGFLEHFYAWITRSPVASPVSQVTGGPGWYIIDDQSGASPNPYIVVSNHSAANIAANPNRYDEPHKIFRIGYVGTEAAYIRVEAYLWYNVATNTGYGRYSTKRISTYDSADFAYRFAGGPEQISIASRRGTDWESVVIGEWEGDANLVLPTTTVGVLQSGVTAGSDVVLQLGAGQAVNFTEGHYAWLYDFNGNNWCDYVLVNDVDPYTDQITINQCSQNFGAGSVIGAYVHRFFLGGSRQEGTVVSAVGPFQAADYYRLAIPYYSRYSYEMIKAASRIDGAANAKVMDDVLGQGSAVPTTPGMAPNDRGFYAVQRPLVGEYRSIQNSSNTTSMNRYYGAMKNVYGACENNMLQMVDGRRINNLNHVYFEKDGRYGMGNYSAILLPDYDSVA